MNKRDTLQGNLSYFLDITAKVQFCYFNLKVIGRVKSDLTGVLFTIFGVH